MIFDYLLPWQEADWSKAATLVDRLPQAILFSGQRGIGKVSFARYFGRALLCQNPGSQSKPCGICVACGWIANGNHPDYRLLRPHALELAEGVEQADGESGDDEPRESVEDSTGQGKERGAASKEVRIQQVRALTQALSISSHRAGRRVAGIYPAEAMNNVTANALLKLLEEPPADTLFLLVTDAPDRLLPTILSRCRNFPLTAPTAGEAIAWLGEHEVRDAAVRLAEAGGAPLAALVAAQETPAHSQFRAILLQLLAKPGGLGSLGAVDGLAKCELTLVVGWTQRWLYDCIGYRLARRIRYYPSHKEAIAQLAERLDLGRCFDYARTLNSERRVCEHPLNARLFIENLILGYSQAVTAG